MSGFQMPFSSSPPSTPDRKSSNAGKHWFGESNPSTTPAGPPPPSSAGSFTPAGPPPSSILGNSRLGSQYDSQPFSFSNQSALKSSNFQFSNQKSAPALGQVAKPLFGGVRSGLSNEYKASLDVESEAGDDDADGETESDQYQREDEYSEEEDDHMTDDGAEDTYREDEADDTGYPRFDSSGPIPNDDTNRYGASRNSDVFLQSPAMRGYNRDDDLMEFSKSLQISTTERPKEPVFGKIAKEICTQMGTARIQESDDLVLGTEELIERLYEEGVGVGDDPHSLHRSLSIIPAELIRLWADYNESIAEHVSEEYTATIGPGPKTSKFSKANFLASLLLRLRHPTPVQIPNDSAQAFKGTLRTFAEPNLETKPIPMLLLEWMDEYHEPYPSQLDELYLHRPSPAHHQLFWETVLNSLLRGKVHGVMTALKNAGWRHARTAAEDLQNNSGNEGYSGKALENIELVIGEATQALSKCPAIAGDWDIRNSDWTLFRLSIQQARENLKSFAEGRNRDKEFSEYSNTIHGDQTMTATARKAQSQVPWSIYQRLLSVYNLVLGDPSTIVETAMDWCEASICLVIWWDTSKDRRRSRFGHPPRAILDVPESQLYLDKLAESFYRATAESTEFQVNTLNPVEVALACLFEEDVEAVIAFLRSWSGPISAAVVEIASLGGWLPRTEPSLITMESLDEDDMEVLGITPPSSKVDDVKDLTLITYAEALSQHGRMQCKPGFGKAPRAREGWELAIEVLGRLNSTTRSEEEVGEMLKNFTFDTSANVDKMWQLLNDLGMTRQAETVAEEYADSLAEGSFKYGEALWYYALSHKSEKVKNVLDLLISFSLIHSMAFPPSSNVDPYLQRLISSPTAALAEMSKLDFDAAQILHKMLAGYATLRRFYDLRDEEVTLAPGQKPTLRPVARRAEAASALMAVIASADDNIRGGLFDEKRGAVVGVDFLLALLGEALVFVNQQPNTSTSVSPSPLPPAHIHLLLKAIEDVQTVRPRIYRACDDFFQTVVSSTQGLNGSSPLDLLRKSESSLSAATSGAGSFSLAGSSILASQLQRSIAGSGALVKGSDVPRGWDWRRGLSAHTTSEDILRILRLGLAKDLAKAWLREADARV